MHLQTIRSHRKKRRQALCQARQQSRRRRTTQDPQQQNRTTADSGSAAEGLLHTRQSNVSRSARRRSTRLRAGKVMAAAVVQCHPAQRTVKKRGETTSNPGTGHMILNGDGHRESARLLPFVVAITGSLRLRIRAAPGPVSSLQESTDRAACLKSSTHGDERRKRSGLWREPERGVVETPQSGSRCAINSSFPDQLWSYRGQRFLPNQRHGGGALFVGNFRRTVCRAHRKPHPQSRSRLS